MDLPDGAAPAAPGAFAGSRRLAGANRWFPAPAVAMQALGPGAKDGAAQGRWIALVVDMARALGWRDPLPRVHLHPEGAESSTWLVFAAPVLCLRTASALNQWAWQAAADLDKPHPLGADPVAHFKSLAAAEEQTALQALAQAAEDHALPLLMDEDRVSIGEGAGSVSYERAALPDAASVPWPRLHTVPKLWVAGSHGKTTVLRLLAAMATESGLVPGVGRLGADASDHAEADALSVLRDPGITTALLEAPRGNLLEQGLPVKSAQVAVITNVSADLRGEQAQDELDERAATLLVVAHAVAHSAAEGGALVMNGDDAAVLRVALGLAHSAAPTWALFSRDHATPLLDAMRRHGGSTCAPRDGRLVLAMSGVEHDLGAIADMPLSLGGRAVQNTANLAAAALAAAMAGWPLEAVQRVLMRFGAKPQDNPGRLEHWTHRGATVLVDSAHHADSLAQLLKLAAALGARRVGLLLGQDGRRSDAAIALLAQTAAGYRPDRVLITEWPGTPGQAAPREPGVVPLLLEQALRAAGLPSRALRHEHDEEAAARALLDWAKAGDVVVLPLRSPAVRDRLQDMLTPPR